MRTSRCGKGIVRPASPNALNTFRLTAYCASKKTSVGTQNRYAMAMDESLTALKEQEPVVGRLVELRFFGGLTIEQAATVLKVSSRSANRYWVYAKAWLSDRME